MSLKLADVKEATGKDFGRLEDGPHMARIVSVIDFGNQDQEDYNTKEATAPKDKILITFETPNECITYDDKEGNTVTKPRWIGKEYTLSTHKMAALTKVISALAPDISELSELLNVPCMITVGTTDGGKAKIIGVAAPMKGFDVPELQNDTFHFDMSEPDMDRFAKLPDWVRERIKGANNYDGFADKKDDF